MGDNRSMDGTFPRCCSVADADWAERLIFSHQNGNVSARSQQYRDNSGALFDMMADPAQTKDIRTTNPASRRRWPKRSPHGAPRSKSKDDRPYPWLRGIPTHTLPRGRHSTWRSETQRRRAELLLLR